MKLELGTKLYMIGRGFAPLQLLFLLVSSVLHLMWSCENDKRIDVNHFMGSILQF